MKMLVTGAAGFIGGHLVESLLKEGHEVIGIDNLFHPSSNPINKTVRIMDVRNYNDIEPLIEWCDVVFHLAAQIHVDRSILEPQETIDINVSGTLNVLEAVRKFDKKMVFASSSEIYGTQRYSGGYCQCQGYDMLIEAPGKITELHPLDAQSPYAASKVAGDRLCYSYYKTYGTKVAILRNFNAFGPYQADNSYGAVIGIFARKALLGEPLQIYGDGNQERDYIYVNDAVRGYHLCYEKELWGKPVNICSGSTITINELANKIIKITKSKSIIEHIDPRPGEVQRLCGDNSFAVSRGFKLETDFDKNLNEYINHKKNDIKSTIL